MEMRGFKLGMCGMVNFAADVDVQSVAFATYRLCRMTGWGGWLGRWMPLLGRCGRVGGRCPFVWLTARLFHCHSR